MNTPQTIVAKWERVRTDKGWHIRFRSANNELVVDGENLTSLTACNTAILAVARAHAPIGGGAAITPIRKPSGGLVLSLRDPDGHISANVPVIDVDERQPTRTERVVTRIAKRITR